MIEKENEYRAALYCRLSSDDAYLGESGSIQTQKALLNQYCKENNIPVYDVYVDDGFSGTNFERPDFKRMLADLENHKANLVIVKDLSRFGREYAQMGMYIENDFEDWNATSIRAILNNPVYLGQTTFGRTKVKGKSKKKKIAADESEWIVVENTHEPLVDKETWDLVHDIMKNRRTGIYLVSSFIGLRLSVPAAVTVN